MQSARLALIAVLVATFIWGATPPIAKHTFAEVPPFVVAFLRFVIATLLFFPLLGFQDKLSKVSFRDYPFLTLLSVLGVTLSIGLFFVGLNLTSAIDAGIIVSTGPVFNAIAAKMFLKEKLSRLHWIGTVLATIGTLIIIAIQPFLDGNTISLNILGNVLLLLAVLASTAFNIMSKESLRKFDATTLTGFTFLIGAFSFLPFALWESNSNPEWSADLTVSGILGLLFLGIFASTLAYFLYEWALEKVPVSATLPMTFLQPAITVAVAIPLLGEKINAPFVVGSVFIFLGMFLSTKHTPEHHKRSAHHKV